MTDDERLADIAQRYTADGATAGLGLVELVTAGGRGLAEAKRRYEPGGTAWATYSNWWIRQAITQAISDAR